MAKPHFLGGQCSLYFALWQDCSLFQWPGAEERCTHHCVQCSPCYEQSVANGYGTQVRLGHPLSFSVRRDEIQLTASLCSAEPSHLGNFWVPKHTNLQCNSYTNYKVQCLGKKKKTSSKRFNSIAAYSIPVSDLDLCKNFVTGENSQKLGGRILMLQFNLKPSPKRIRLYIQILLPYENW